MFRILNPAAALAVILAVPVFAPVSRAQDSQNKNLDIKSSVGDLHVGGDADAKKAGLPLYPGARPKTDDKDNSQANLSLLTEAFGMKLIVANYVSNDSPDKVIDFYRDKLKNTARCSNAIPTNTAST